MGRTVSIRFKDGKVSKVSGARTPEETASAAAFGQAFVDTRKTPRVEGEDGVTDAQANLLATIRQVCQIGGPGHAYTPFGTERRTADALVAKGLVRCDGTGLVPVTPAV